jgi:hypothetical protein
MKSCGRVPRGSAFRREILSRPMMTAANFVPTSLVDVGAGARPYIELANARVLRVRGAIDPSLRLAALTAAGQLHGPRRSAS